MNTSLEDEQLLNLPEKKEKEAIVVNDQTPILERKPSNVPVSFESLLKPKLVLKTFTEYFLILL